MAEIKSAATFEARFILKLTEQEAKALLMITMYGSKPFTDWFYRNLGKHYLKPEEQGLISLFKTIESELPQHLKKADEARKIFKP